VLLVEDEPLVAEFMGELLRGWGLDVAAFGNPVEALAAAERDAARFDLVLTDHTMPRITGLDLACRMRTLRADLPVILYSGYTDLIDPDRLAACGVTALLRKPVEQEALLALLGEHLSVRAVSAGA
jgi:CheY-like chemotaxis protein